MKQVKKAVLAGICAGSMMFSGCGNRDPFFVQHQYDKAYVNFGDHIEEVEIDSWKAGTDVIILKCRDGRILRVDAMNIILEEN